MCIETVIKTLAVAASALFAVACGGNKNYENLTANEWVLDRVECADSASQIVVPDAKPLRMAFADSSKAVFGIAPCNGFFGPFVADGDNIKFGSMASTMAYCLEMPFEDAYHAWLRSVATYKATESTLTLKDADNKLTLYYVKNSK